MSRTRYHDSSDPGRDPPIDLAPRGTVTGAASTAANKVSGAAVRQPGQGGADSPVTITLCDGSQFTFSRFVDDRVLAEA